MPIEQAGQQNLAVIGNLSSVEGLNQVLRSKIERQLDTDNSTKVEESSLKKALKGEKRNVGTSILAKLATKLAQSMPTSEILDNLQDEYQFVTNPQEDSIDDFVDIRDPIAYYTKEEKKNNQEKTVQLVEDESDSQGKKGGSIREYVGAYSQMLVNGGSELKRKAEQMEARLLDEEVISLKDLQGVKAQAAKSVRAEVVKQIKRAYLKKALTSSKSLEGLIANKELNNSMDYGFLNERLGGFDFGGYKNDLQGAVDSVVNETRGELRDFVRDALTDEVVKKTIGKEGEEGKQVEKDIEEFLKLGQKVGMDLKAFLDKIPKLKDDLGLNPEINVVYLPFGENANGEQQERHQFHYTQEEEKEILTDKLRALYMRRAMCGDLRTVMGTQFKMIRTKNGLIRLGIKNEQFEEIEAEGKALARIKLFEMLQEAFEEKATYAKLTGMAWKMTERKIKTILKNLERVGVSLSQMELDLIRDKANEKMHAEAKEELSLINTAIEVQGELAYFTTRKKMVEGIIERLAGETALLEAGNELKLTIQEAC